MAIRIGWGNANKNYLYYQFSGNWTWTQHFSAIQQMQMLRQETDATQIPVVINLADTDLIPPASFRYLAHALLNQYPPHGIIIFTGMSYMTKAVLKTLMQLYPQMTGHIRLAQDLHHACYILHREGYLQRDAD